MKDDINEAMRFLGQMREEQHDVAVGFDNAYATLAEAAFTATSFSSLIEVVDVLERHAIEDGTKPYSVCWGEREFYRLAIKLFKSIKENKYD